MEAFKQGDVVMLRSGGPALTVVSVWEHSMDHRMMATCGWFDPSCNYQEQHIPFSALDRHLGSHMS